MDITTLHWTHPWLGLGTLLIIIAGLLWYYWRPATLYTYPLVEQLLMRWPQSDSSWLRIVTIGSRVLALLLAACAAGGPAIPEGKSSTYYEGIDIMVVLDVSGSMQQQDDPTARTRLAAAKAEAIRFIAQRPHDAIGLVIFAYGAACRCPLTHDHRALIEVIEGLEINAYLPHHVTHLFRGVASALNRLAVDRKSRKVIILITDGNSNQGDVPGESIVTIARSLGVKIYTIGIGSPRQLSPFAQLFDEGPNRELLEAIAQATGGRSYMAYTQEEMQQIYAAIDALEKQQYDVQLIGNYRDIGIYLLWAAALSYLLSLLIACWVVIV
ncbi:VWA domain-containing protein [Candidatus Dependentiae bacterium]|nr:VWA domain-containing protein [Candidatus Dependentiae bacterium]